MISDAELNQIEERARAATEGPWEVFTIASSAGESSRIFSDALGPAADIAHIPMPWNGDGSNAAFIAAARTDVPALVAALREARGVVREVVENAEPVVRVLDACYSGNAANWPRNRVSEAGWPEHVEDVRARCSDLQVALDRARALGR
jgi:hypothetical protein